MSTIFLQRRNQLELGCLCCDDFITPPAYDPSISFFSSSCVVVSKHAVKHKRFLKRS